MKKDCTMHLHSNEYRQENENRIKMCESEYIHYIILFLRTLKVSGSLFPFLLSMKYETI